MNKYWITTAFAFIASLFGCGFQDTKTPHGTPNLVEFAPRLWRMGEPPTDAAWEDVVREVDPLGVSKVLVVKLNDEKEGSDDFAEKTLGWRVLRVPLPPEDDKPWTVFEKPAPADVARAVDETVKAYETGWTVVGHCTHGRDRTSLWAALVQMRLFGMTKDAAWKDMLVHGFRWELPNLDAYWLEDVQEMKDGERR